MADLLGVETSGSRAVNVPLDGEPFVLAFNAPGPVGGDTFGDRPMGTVMLIVPTDGTRYWVLGNTPGLRDGQLAVVIERNEPEANMRMAVLVGDEVMFMRVSSDCSELLPGGFDRPIPTSQAKVLGILWSMQRMDIISRD